MVGFPWYDPQLEEIHFELDRGPRTYEIICPGGFLPHLVWAIQTSSHDQIRITHELTKYIERAGQEEFKKFEEEHTDLGSYLRTWCFRLTKQDGIDTVNQCLDRTPLHPADDGIEFVDTEVPSFNWNEVKVIHPWSGFCSKVEVEDVVLNSFIVCNLPFWRDEFCFYLKLLKRISHSSSEASKRAPQLKGILRSPSGRVHGRLENFVHGPKLHELAIEQISRTRRERWASQILETVLALHALDVLWGGYHRSLLEITIDANDDAHIGDISGGVWVLNEDIGELELKPFTTKEEDLKAVEMLHDFLRVGEVFRRNAGLPQPTTPSTQLNFNDLPRDVRLQIYEYFVRVREGLAWTVDGFSIKRPAGFRAPDEGHIGLKVSQWVDPPLSLVSREMRREVLDFFASCNVFYVECSWIPGFIRRFRTCADSLRRVVLTMEISENPELLSAQTYGLEKLLHSCRSLTSIELILSHQRSDFLCQRGWWQREPLLLLLRRFRGLHSLSVSSIWTEVIPFREDIEKWLQDEMFQED